MKVYKLINKEVTETFLENITVIGNVERIARYKKYSKWFISFDYFSHYNFEFQIHSIYGTSLTASFDKLERAEELREQLITEIKKI